MLTDNRLKKITIIFAILSGYFILIFYPHYINNYSFCLFKDITGIPCPACGSTRATILLFKGDILQSILLNPLALITNFLIIFSLLWLIYELLTGSNKFLDFMKKDWNAKYKILIAIIIILNWAWNIKKGI